MRTGNVIRSPAGGLWIITDVNDVHVSAVAFDAENVSAVRSLADCEEERECPFCVGTPNSGCETCHGTSSYMAVVKGWKCAKVEATCVKKFIMKQLSTVWGERV